MSALQGRTVVFLGRLAAMPQRLARDLLVRQGATTARSLSRRTDLAVVGRLGHRLIDRGRLPWLVQRARSFGIPCMSESRFLVAVGQRSPQADEARTVSLDVAIRQAGLATDMVELLALFDVIAPENDLVNFRDVVALKEAGRLLAQGASLGEIVAGALALARPQDSAENSTAPSLTRGGLVRTAEEGLLLRVGERLAELDGQLRLGLSEPDPTTLHELFDSATAAEDAGDLPLAERLHRRCVARAPRDAAAAFNLANLLREAGKRSEARLYFERALALDPWDAEAWYNLADLTEAAGDDSEAKLCLERALGCDANFADALFNLGRLLYRTGAYDDAIVAFERYLALDAESEWAKLARDHLAICRQARQRAGNTSH